MSNSWKVENPFETLWDDEEYNQLLEDLSAGKISKEDALDQAKIIKDNRENPTLSDEDMQNIGFPGGPTGQGMSSELGGALDLLLGIAGPAIDFIKDAPRKSYKQTLADFDEDPNELAQNRTNNYENYLATKRLDPYEKSLYDAEKILDNEFNLQRQQELGNLVVEYGNQLDDDITEDSEGNTIIKGPTEAPINFKDYGVGVNYTKEDLVEHYKAQVPWLRDKVKNMSKEEGDDFVYNYVDKYAPEATAPFKWEEKHGWGKGYLWNEIKNTWHQSWERWAHTGKSMALATAAHVAGEDGQGLTNPEKRKKFKEELKDIYPNETESWYEDYIDEVVQGDLERLYKAVLDNEEEAKKRAERLHESDKRLAAQREWNMKNVGSEWSMKEDGFDNFGKYATNLALSSIPSVIESVMAGKATALAIGSMAYVGTLAYTRSHAAAKLSFANTARAWTAMMPGQFAYGYGMMGGQHLIDAINQQTRFQELSKEEFLKIAQAKESELKNKELFKKWMSDHLLEKDGKYYKKPVSKAEAIDNAIVAAEVQGVVGGVIEQADILFMNAGILPKNMMGTSSRVVYQNLLDKIDDVTRTIKTKSPKIGRPIVGITGSSARFVARGVSEGLEEVGQELSDIGIKVHGPMFLDDFKWTTDTTWSEEFSYNQMRDAFLGGVIGGGAAGGARISAQNQGFYDYLANRGTKNYLEANDMRGYYAKNYGSFLNPKWRIVQTSPKVNEVTGETILETHDVVPGDKQQIEDSDTGEIHQTEFNNVRDALAKAGEFNKAYIKESREIHTWLNRSLIGNDVVVEEIKDEDWKPGTGFKKGKGKFIVRIRNENGDIVENVEQFDNKKQANKKLKEINRVKIQAEEYLEQSDYDDVKQLRNSPAVQNLYNKVLNHTETNDTTVIEDTTPDATEETTTAPEYQRSDYSLALKSFLFGSIYANKAGVKLNKKEREEVSYWENRVAENPHILRDALREDGILEEIAPDGTIAKEELLREIEDEYGVSHPEIVKEIREDFGFAPDTETETKPDQETKVDEVKVDEVKDEVKPEVKEEAPKTEETAPEIKTKDDTIKDDVEVREDVKVRPEQKVTPQNIKDYTDQELDAKIEQAKKDSKSRTKSKKKRAKLALKVAEKEKKRRIEIEKETYDEDITITEPKEILTIEQADKMLEELAKKRARFVEANLRADGDSNIVNLIKDTDKAIEEIEKKKADIKKEKKKAPKQINQALLNEYPRILELQKLISQVGRNNAQGKSYLNELYDIMDRVDIASEQDLNDAIKELEESLEGNQGELFKLKGVIQEGSKEQKETEEILDFLFNKFSGEIEYETINDPTLYKNGKPVEAYYDTKNKKVVINTAFATASSPFHEFSHPFITILRLENKTLFDNLVKEILATPEGKTLLKTITQNYGPDKSPTDVEILEELLAFSIEQSAYKMYKPQSKFKRVVNKILDWFRGLFFGKPNTVYAQALDTNTSINDIARLLTNSDVTIRFKDKNQSLANTNYDFSANPQNIYQFKLKIEKEGKEVAVSNTGVVHIKGTDSQLKEVETKVNKVIDETPSNQPGEKGTERPGHKTVWFGPVNYKYTGSKHIAKDMPPEIVEIMRAVEEVLGLPEGYYDSVLINKYAEGKGIPEHQDDEDIFVNEDGTINNVGVVSFGGSSKIYISEGRTAQGNPVVETHEIKDGEVYALPEGTFQNIYFHAVGESTGPRVSLTFRRTNVAPPIETKKESPHPTVTKIISGMQTGGDQGGLEAGAELGIPTGGTAPKGYNTKSGKQPDIGKKYNIIEDESSQYPPRAIKNVKDSDATIAFRLQKSLGTDKTIGYAQTESWEINDTKPGEYNDGFKPVLVLDSAELTPENIQAIRDFVAKHPGVLNIAGHTEQKVPGLQEKVKNLLVAALKEDIKTQEDTDFQDILTEIGVQSKQVRDMYTFLEGTWSVMMQLAKDNNMSINISDFVGLVTDTLTNYGANKNSTNLKLVVEKWAADKFAFKKIMGGKNNSLIPVENDNGIDMTDKLFEVLSGVDEGLDFKTMFDSEAIWEKELTVIDIMFLKELNVSITVEQLHDMYRAVRNEEYTNFEDWKEYVLKKVLNRSIETTPKENRGLLRLFNRLDSSVPTNADVFSKTYRRHKAYAESDFSSLTFNYRTNYIFNYTWDKESKRFVYTIQPKGPIKDNGRSNPQFDKIFMWEYDNPTDRNLFHWISGTDVVQKQKQTDKNGKAILKDGEVVWLDSYRYNYLHYNGNKKDMDPNVHFLALENELRKHGRTIAFSKGDDETIATVEITQEHKIKAKNKADAEAYWNQELEDGYLKTPKQIEELMEGDAMDRASNIAVHEAMKKIWPKYAGQNAANVYKRIKIPFSKVTKSKSMPNFFVEKFDPKNVMFRYTDPETGIVNEFDPRQDMGPLGLVYIGDGNSLTSNSFFDLLVEHFGLSPNQAKAKTVIYEKVGDDIIAIKHAHVLPKLGFEIVAKTKDGSGEVLYSVDENRNITNEKTEEPVHILNTSDEIKVGDMFGKSFDEGGESNKPQLGRFEASGQSLGFINFDEKVKSELPHIMQWYNHVTDTEIINTFVNEYVPKLRLKLRKLLTISKDEKNNPAWKKISTIISNLENENEEAYVSHIVELARLGGAMHPSISGLIDKVIQNQIINPLVKLADSSGSLFYISMDMSGQLDRNEISLSRDNAIASGIVIKQYAKAKGQSIKDAENIARTEPERINAWLNETDGDGNYINEVLVWVTRSPVPHVGGAYMARVASINGRKGIADLNPLDVKEKIEGDGDGDKVHVELLPPEMVGVYNEFIKNNEPSALNLSHFVKGSYNTIMNVLGRINLIRKLTFGQKAISEVANITLAYGSINKVMNGWKIPIISNITKRRRVIRVRRPDEIISTDMYYELSDNKKWSGPISEYLRIFLQGAVDNGKYGLLNDWNYNQEELSRKLFVYSDTGEEISGFDYLTYIAPIMRLHKKAQQIRQGRITGQNKMSGKQLFTESQNYLEYVENRKEYLKEGKHLVKRRFGVEEKAVDDVSIKINETSPIEQIAISPAMSLNDFMITNKIFGIDGSPWVMKPHVFENAHYYAMQDMEDIFKPGLEFYANNENINPITEDEIAKSYYEDMIAEYKEIIVTYVEEGTDSLERNPKFLSWQNKFGDQFKNMSSYAQIVASYLFLRDYTNLINDISVKRSSSVMPSFPPTSQLPGKVSLLRPSVISKYFERYNQQIMNSRSEIKLEKNEVYTSTLSIANMIYKKEC